MNRYDGMKIVVIEGKEGMEIGGEGSDRGEGRDGDWGRR